ncbi:hypothetical protein NEMIN01_0886 [Nematocida minor]|uniref:uncharacterized protein n=1 Tax=Nematocida minor TaxID=1912983 RepID=UPI00221FE408|nr:uncharacterized protein NEMIN01_0886 [Nematocida minor]KAI5190101.1 hypothetical protein NEMIN01_0886 [Nematocida minor]
MTQEERNRGKVEKSKKAPDSIDCILSDQDELDIDNIRLIDYGAKDDELLKDLSINDEESIDELDMTKIYENELEQSDDDLEIGDEEMKKIRGFEESINQKTKNKRNMLSTFYPHMETGYNSHVPDLNSDVDNDICKENIKKIYSYLKEDQEKEEEIQREIEKTIEYIGNIRKNNEQPNE